MLLLGIVLVVALQLTPVLVQRPRDMINSIRNVLFGTFTLRFSTGLTGGLLAFYLGQPARTTAAPEVTAIAFALLYAAFYVTELRRQPVLWPSVGPHRVTTG